MNALLHNVAPSLRAETVRCGDHQEAECQRKRLRLEYLCSEKDKDNPAKGYTYSMTKRCERVFIKKDKARLVSVSPMAIKKFEILVEEYRKNAEQYKIPEVFRTILSIVPCIFITFKNKNILLFQINIAFILRAKVIIIYAYMLT